MPNNVKFIRSQMEVEDIQNLSSSQLMEENKANCQNAVNQMGLLSSLVSMRKVMPPGKRIYSRSYKCNFDLCKFSAPTKVILRDHSLQTHGRPYFYKYKCPVCSFRTDDRSYLRLHVGSIHGGEKNYPCPCCEYRATQSSSLRKHIRSIHAQGKNYLKCEVCQFRSEQRTDLENHVKAKHLGLKPFLCDICGMGFRRNPDMLKHKSAVHFKLQPYRCVLCNFKTSHSNSLRSHLRSVHAHLKPHQCHFCHKTYCYMHSLKTHINSVHFNIVPRFECNHCPFISRQKYYLKKHIWSVHEATFL